MVISDTIKIMEKIPVIQSHDVSGVPDQEGNRKYFEHEVLSHEALSKREKRLMAQMDSIFHAEGGDKREEMIRTFGRVLGKKIADEIKADYNYFQNRDIKGKARGGSYLQQVITKAALLGQDVSIFSSPYFIEEFENASNNFLEGNYGIEAQVKGAKSVAEYYDTLSDDQDIVFTGLSMRYDVLHSIDMMVGRSDTGEFLDTMDLCEVKTSRPHPDQIINIHEKHNQFVKAHKEIILNGLGTIETRHRIEQLNQIDQEAFTQMVEDRMTFLRKFSELEYWLPEVKTWDDIVARAKRMKTNPVLLAVRLRNMTPASMPLLTTPEREKLIRMKDEIFKMEIPAKELGLYKRLVRNDGHHIGHALEWRSIVAYKMPNGTWREDKIIIDTI